MKRRHHLKDDYNSLSWGFENLVKFVNVISCTCVHLFVLLITGYRGIWIHQVYARLFPLCRWVQVTGDRWTSSDATERGPLNDHHEHETGACSQNLCKN